MNFYRRKAFLVPGALVLLLTLLYVFRGPLLAPVIRRAIVAGAAENLGVRCSIGAVSGNYFTELVLRDVQVSAARPNVPDGAVLAVRELRLSYRPLDYFISAPRFLAGLGVEITGLAARGSLPELTAWFQGQDNAPSQSTSIGSLPRLKIRDSSIEIVDSGKRLLLEGLDFELAPQAGAPALSLDGALTIKTVAWTVAEASGQTSFAAKFETSKNSVTLTDIFLAEQLFSRQASFTYETAGKFALTGRMDLFGGVLRLDAAREQGELRAALTLSAVDLAETAALPAARQYPVQGKVSADAAMRFRQGDLENIEASWSLTMADGAIGDIPVERLDFQGASVAGLLTVKAFDLVTSGNSCTLKDLTIPVRSILQANFKEMLRAAAGNFSLRLQDIPAAVRMFGGTVPEQVEKSGAGHELLLTGSMQKGTLALARGTFTSGAGNAEIRGGNIRFSAGAQSLETTAVEADLTLAVRDVLQIGSLVGFTILTGSLTGDVHVSGLLAGLQADLDVHGENITFWDIPLGTVDLQGLVAKGAIDFKRCTMKRGPDSLTMVGGYDFLNHDFHDLLFEGDLRHAADYLVKFSSWLQIGGRLAGMVRVHGPWPASVFDLDLQAGDGKLWGLPFATMAVLGKRDGNLLVLERGTLSRGPFTCILAGGGSADFSREKYDFTIERLALTRQEHQWQLRQPLCFSHTAQDGLVFEEFMLEGGGDTLKAAGSYSAAKELDITADISAATGKGWLDLLGERLLLRDAAVSLVFKGSMAVPQFRAQGTVARVGSRDLPRFFNGDFDLAYTAVGLDVRRFDWHTPEGSRISASGTVPVSFGAKTELLPGPLDFTVAVDIAELLDIGPFLPTAFSASGQLSGEARFSGTWDDPRGRVIVTASELRAPRLAELFVPLPLTLSAAGILQNDRFTVEDFSCGSSHLQLQAGGSLENLPPLPSLILGDGDRGGAQISADIRVIADDIGWLTTGTKKLQKTAGAVRADLALRGELLHPDLTGSVSLEHGEVWHDLPSMPPFRNLSLASTIREGVLVVDSMQGEMGGAPFRASGTIGIQSLPLEIDLRLQGENLLFYREEGVKVRADADLILTGPLSRLKIGGNVAVSDGSFTRKFDFISALRGSFRSKNIDRLLLPSFHEQPLKDAELHVMITAKKPFVVKNNVARGLIRPDLLLQGTGEVPYLTGRLYLDEGLLNLPAGRLIIDTGLINYPANDPDNPSVEMRGRSRIAGYDISLNIQGRLAEPVVTLTSSPPIAESELLYLVLAGKPPSRTTGSGTIGQTKNMKVALYLGQELLDQLFGGDSPVSEIDLLERFEIDVGKGITRKGDETIEAQFRLLDEVITKGGTLSITSEKDVYDEYNMGLRILIRFK